MPIALIYLLITHISTFVAQLYGLIIEVQAASSRLVLNEACITISQVLHVVIISICLITEVGLNVQGVADIFV